MSLRAAALLCAVAVLAGGCSRQEAAWRQAERAGTHAAYEAYLEAFPAGTHARAARDRLATLAEERDWSRASRLDTPEAYQRYLAAHPGGARATAARERLVHFLAQPPAAAAPLAPPAGSPPPEPAALDDRGGAWLQLAAFASGPGAANAAWPGLAARHPEMLGDLGYRVHSDAGDAGPWRLQAGPLSPVEGERRCALLRAAGTACLLRRGDGG